MAFQPIFNITNPVANALTNIERARGFLDATHLSNAWIAKMQSQALVREAHFTTHIEGTQLTLEQSEKLLAGKIVQEAREDDKKELLNYRDAFELVSQYIGDGGPITQGVIREIHKRLVNGVRGNAAAPGEYRKVPNYVVNSITKEVIYTPPPANELPILMAELVQWINETTEINPVLVSGMAQFQFVHIHPFLDGNGRTARLLSTLCLYKTGYDFKRLFTLSEYYDRDRPAYYKAIQIVRENGMDMTPWLEYYTDGLATQMQEVRHLGELVIRKDVISKTYQLNDRQQKALAFLLEHGRMNIQDYEQLCPKTNRRTLQRELKEMIDNALLLVEGETNRRIYRLKEQE